MGQTNNTRKQPILSRPFIPEGNDFEIMIDMKKADTEEYIDYDLTTCKNIIVYLTCGAHGTEIPLQYAIVDNHKLKCPVNHKLLHANTSYGIVVEGDTDEDKHWQYTIMPREGIAIIPNTSGEVIPDGTTTIDIQGRVGFIGAVGPQGPPGTTDYNELENKPDLSIYATKTELDNKQDTLVSGSNIKTINNESILGSGNIDIQGGGGGDYSEQFKTTADALWDLDHRINKSEYITNKKLESIENSTKDTLDEFGDNINEQLSVTANTFIELLKWKEGLQTTTNEIIEQNAWLFNTNVSSTLTATT